MGKSSGELFLIQDIDYSEVGNFGGFGIKKKVMIILSLLKQIKIN